MTTVQNPFVNLKNMPITTQYAMPKQLNHPNDPNKIIISTDYEEPEAGTFEMDLVSNELKQLHKYGDQRMITNLMI